ncbi:MAG: methionyl-tRNA formyltransferase [Bacteroidetes bacterium]|nr:methionyl-tRNA formyltransferase [Bacteroidota bacterium]
MRIVFMGTPEFAVPCLDILLKNAYDIVGVVTAPDKAAGRGQLLQSSPVKQYALEHGLNILQPERLKGEKFIEELKSLNADLQIVVAFRMLPEAVWNLPSQGTYNLHASLLPKYRGAAPINWAVINGEKESGVTTFKLKHEIDTGNILMNDKVSLTEETTAGELYDILMHKGAELLLKTVKKIEESMLTHEPLSFITQKDYEACHAPKIFKETCRINWNKTVEEIYNLVRGLSPYPAAFTELLQEDKCFGLKIFSGTKEITNNSEPNGSLITDNKTFLKIKCSKGYFAITELQLQGKKRMKVAEFLRGFTIKSNANVI